MQWEGGVGLEKEEDAKTERGIPAVWVVAEEMYMCLLLSHE